MTEVLGKHPGVREAVHTSIPEYLECLDIKTRWPDLSGADFVVWMLRYEYFRKTSVERLNYNVDRDPEFLPPKLYQNCTRLISEVECPVVPVSYAGLVGPCGDLVLRLALKALGLNADDLPTGLPPPHDANAKYIAACEPR